MQISGDAVRRARERLALTQSELAKRAGLTEATVNRIEGNRHEPRVTTVRKLADALDVTVETLMPELPRRVKDGDA